MGFAQCWFVVGLETQEEKSGSTEQHRCDVESAAQAAGLLLKNTPGGQCLCNYTCLQWFSRPAQCKASPRGWCGGRSHALSDGVFNSRAGR